ncbi:hypothetical protein Dimus_004120 [Dionaea muscipula]
MGLQNILGGGEGSVRDPGMHEGIKLLLQVVTATGEEVGTAMIVMIFWSRVDRYRGRRSRSRSISPSPPYRRRKYSRSPFRNPSRYRPSARVEKRPSSSSRSWSPSPSQSRSRSLSLSASKSSRGSPAKQASNDRSRSSTGSPPGKKGLVYPTEMALLILGKGRNEDSGLHRVEIAVSPTYI